MCLYRSDWGAVATAQPSPWTQQDFPGGTYSPCAWKLAKCPAVAAVVAAAAAVGRRRQRWRRRRASRRPCARTEPSHANTMRCGRQLGLRTGRAGGCRACGHASGACEAYVYSQTGHGAAAACERHCAAFECRGATPAVGKGWHAARAAAVAVRFGPGRVGDACLLSGGLHGPSRDRSTREPARAGECLCVAQRG